MKLRTDDGQYICAGCGKKIKESESPLIPICKKCKKKKLSKLMKWKK